MSHMNTCVYVTQCIESLLHRWQKFTPFGRIKSSFRSGPPSFENSHLDRPDYFFFVSLAYHHIGPGARPWHHSGNFYKCCLWQDIPFGQGWRNNSNSKQLLSVKVKRLTGIQVCIITGRCNYCIAQCSNAAMLQCCNDESC